ncbi:MAG: helix-turn-helix domain-containing protein [Desulfobacterales bacterium]|nr:helix-turn-helix domain-containing protein [Desulfobacterales bacterium]
MLKLFYSTSEVASLFKLNRVTIYRWVKNGDIKAYKIGKHIKIPASEISRLLRQFGFPESAIQDIFGSAKDMQLKEALSKSAGSEPERKLIVAVCDDQNVLDHIENIYKKTGLFETFKLLKFSDSFEAAIQIGKEKPDLAFVDETIAGRKGTELAAKIKSIYNDVKIVIMSNYPDSPKRYIKECIEVFAWLVKPIEHQILEKILRSALT